MARENEALRARLSEADATLRAMRAGEVDTVTIEGQQGQQVFTLHGAEHAYRVLIESMNEGALTLASDKTILFSNQCFSRMVKCPLEQIMGGSFRRFLSAEDLTALRPIMKRPRKSGSKIQVMLHALDGSQMPAQISIRPLAKNGSKCPAIGMVVTDMTEIRRTEEMLRTLTHRVVQVQEAERGSVALELHENITQLLCAILVRSQTLANMFAKREGPFKTEAVKLREMLGHAAEEVERISRNLRPSVLDELGLVAVLHDTSAEFQRRTGVPVKLVCVELDSRLPADIELTLYRVLQEALKNVERHSRARNVAVKLIRTGDFIQLSIRDDGIGFDPDRPASAPKGTGGFGLLGMRERAAYVGGALKVKFSRLAGTEIEVRIPLPPKAVTEKRTEL
jgi:PAS domain S-box-containing protein